MEIRSSASRGSKIFICVPNSGSLERLIRCSYSVRRRVTGSWLAVRGSVRCSTACSAARAVKRRNKAICRSTSERQSEELTRRRLRVSPAKQNGGCLHSGGWWTGPSFLAVSPPWLPALCTPSLRSCQKAVAAHGVVEDSDDNALVIDVHRPVGLGAGNRDVAEFPGFQQKSLKR